MDDQMTIEEITAEFVERIQFDNENGTHFTAEYLRKAPCSYTDAILAHARAVAVVAGEKKKVHGDTRNPDHAMADPDRWIDTETEERARESEMWNNTLSTSDPDMRAYEFAAELQFINTGCY